MGSLNRTHSDVGDFTVLTSEPCLLESALRAYSQLPQYTHAHILTHSFTFSCETHPRPQVNDDWCPGCLKCEVGHAPSHPESLWPSYSVSILTTAFRGHLGFNGNPAEVLSLFGCSAWLFISTFWPNNNLLNLLSLIPDITAPSKFTVPFNGNRI